jgi:laccase
MLVEHGKTYLLWIINTGLTNDMFFAVAGHRLMVVGTDGHYLKPFTIDHIMISSGQTTNVLLEANRATKGSGDNNRYYMAAGPFFTNKGPPANAKNTTAILEYTDALAPPSAGPPNSPDLPAINNTAAATAYTAQLRSLVTKEHPIHAPMEVDEHMLVTISVNTLPCGPNKTCVGPRGDRLAASLNNVNFVPPTVDILDAYYDSISSVYKPDFPNRPSFFFFNFTAPNPSKELQLTGTKVKVVEYGTVVEVVF